MGQSIDDLLGNATRSLGAPISLLQGNTRQAGTDFGGAFANSIEAVDDIPVVGKYVGPAVAAYYGGPLGYAAAEGVQNGVESARHGASYGNAALGGAESGAVAGAESYAGSQLGGALGDAIGSGMPTPVATPSITSNAGGSLASGTGIGSSSGSLLSTPGMSADDQFMGGQYGPSLAANTGSSIAANAPASSGVANSIGNYLQKPTSDVVQNAFGNSDTVNSIGNYFGSPGLGSQIGGSFGAGFAGQNMGNTLGGLAGADYAGKSINSIYNRSLPHPSGLPGIVAGMALPGDLSGYGGMDQNQQLSNIATQGVYGGGTSNQDDQYFLNMLNNQLVNPTGGGAQPLGYSGSGYQSTNSISPIDNSFLAKLGLGGYQDTPTLLKAMQGWQPPQT